MTKNIKEIDILYKGLDKAVNNGFEWEELNKGLWDDCAEIEKLALLRAFLAAEGYRAVILSHSFAKSIWGEEKYMAYYAGYEEWADATKQAGEESDYDEVQHLRMPLWEYHLRNMAAHESPLQYLEDNV